jgi:hypothetical protein
MKFVYSVPCFVADSKGAFETLSESKNKGFAVFPAVNALFWSLLSQRHFMRSCFSSRSCSLGNYFELGNNLVPR